MVCRPTVRVRVTVDDSIHLRQLTTVGIIEQQQQQQQQHQSRGLAGPVSGDKLANNSEQ